ncbi:MAG: MarR family transcriptional regulator [Egibacteraceae bacterium]
MAELVRAFGLGRGDHTPCGEPLSVAQAHALAELSTYAATPLSQGELADRLQLERSTVSRLVTQMEARGWCRRERDHGDGRMVRLRLTDEGARTADRLARAREQKYASALEDLSEEELRDVLTGLRLLARASAGAARDRDGVDRQTTGQALSPDPDVSEEKS